MQLRGSWVVNVNGVLHPSFEFLVCFASLLRSCLVSRFKFQVSSFASFVLGFFRSPESRINESRINELTNNKTEGWDLLFLVSYF